VRPCRVEVVSSQELLFSCKAVVNLRYFEK
jgi:hypothetical protein